MNDSDPTGLGLMFASSDEGRTWIGRSSGPIHGPVPVSEAMIAYYCSLIEDANPAYWEDGVAPPGMVMVWGFPLQFKPGQKARPTLFGLRVPLPGHHVINVSTDTEFGERLRVGDRVVVEEQIIDVSEIKQTRLGGGHFVTTRSTYSRADGAVAAVNTNVLFRYDTPEDHA